MHQQHTYTKHVVRVADRQATVHMICPHNGSNTFRRLRSIVSLSLRDERRFGYPLAHEVIVSDTALAEFRIGCRASSGDYNRCESLSKEFIRMVKPRFEHRGRPAVILRGSEHNDCI